MVATACHAQPGIREPTPSRDQSRGFIAASVRVDGSIGQRIIHRISDQDTRVAIITEISDEVDAIITRIGDQDASLVATIPKSSDEDARVALIPEGSDEDARPGPPGRWDWGARGGRSSRENHMRRASCVHISPPAVDEHGALRSLQREAGEMDQLLQALQEPRVRRRGEHHGAGVPERLVRDGRVHAGGDLLRADAAVSMCDEGCARGGSVLHPVLRRAGCAELPVPGGSQGEATRAGARGVVGVQRGGDVVAQRRTRPLLRRGSHGVGLQPPCARRDRVGDHVVRESGARERVLARAGAAAVARHRVRHPVPRGIPPVVVRELGSVD